MGTVTSELGKHHCILHNKYTVFSQLYVRTKRLLTRIDSQNYLLKQGISKEFLFFSVFMATNNKKREIGYLVNSAGDQHPF